MHSLQNCYYYCCSNVKDKFRKYLYWVFHKANRDWKCFHHSQQGRSASFLMHCPLLQSPSCSNPTLLLHPTCCCASECGWRKTHHHYHTDHLTSNSWSLTPRGPLMLCSNRSLYPELTHAAIILGAPVSFSPLTSSPPASTWADDLALSFTEK